MQLATQKGCDGVDPDNVNAYNNGGEGFGLASQVAVDYLTFRASSAHSLGIAIRTEKHRRDREPDATDGAVSN